MGMGGGFGGGGMRGGMGMRGPAAGAGNLPFGGIPEELRERADKLLADEPEHPEPQAHFSHVTHDRQPLTLRRFIAPYRVPLLLGLLLVVLETAAMQAGPLLIQIAIDHGIVPLDVTVVALASAAYLGAVFLNGLSGWARIRWTARVGERLMMQLRLRVFSHLQRLSLDFFTKEKAGRLISRMTSDIESLTQLFHEGMVQLFVQGLTIVFVTVVLFFMNPRLAAFTLFLVVPAMVVATLWFRDRSNRGYDLVRQRIADVLSHLSESLGGVRVIAGHNRQRQNLVEHRNIVGQYRDANNDTAFAGAVYGGGTEFVGIAGQALIVLVGGNMVLNGTLTIGQLAAFVLYLSQFFAPIQQMVQIYNSYQRGQAAMRMLRQLLRIQPSVPETPDAQDLPPIRGEIRFEDVTFGYQPDEPVLSDVNLTISEGETLALVGPTGAGKSTIAKLVTRFYDPTEGRVLIDGYDLREVTLASLRRQLGIVPQEPFLFAGSIRDNIAFARTDADDAEVLEACRAVGIDDLVERLPDGIHTPCHERGVSLSSGERQLLALARAFLARPRVLVLDEATSNLDLRSEAKIERALDVVLEGRTAILIAHRLATAMRANRIAVVEDGRIVELGSHDELVAQGGRYAGMYATWQLHAAGASTSSAH